MRNMVRIPHQETWEHQGCFLVFGGLDAVCCTPDAVRCTPDAVRVPEGRAAEMQADRARCTLGAAGQELGQACAPQNTSGSSPRIP